MCQVLYFFKDLQSFWFYRSQEVWMRTINSTLHRLTVAYLWCLPIPALVVCQGVKVYKVCLGLRTSWAEHQTVLSPLHLLHLHRKTHRQVVLVPTAWKWPWMTCMVTSAKRHHVAESKTHWDFFLLPLAVQNTALAETTAAAPSRAVKDWRGDFNGEG